MFGARPVALNNVDHCLVKTQIIKLFPKPANQWNQLPVWTGLTGAIPTFKGTLKGFLFDEACSHEVMLLWDLAAGGFP